jgi:pilus assembly protein Flp/PilA
MRERLIRLRNDDSGATAVEYGLLVAAVAAVLITVVFFLENRLGNTMNNAAAHIN